MAIDAISPIRSGEQVKAISPIKAKKLEEQQKEQVMQMQPAFTAPIYMYPVQPMFVPIPQPMYANMMPQQMVTNPIKNNKDENKVTPQEAMRAQALAQPKTKFVLETSKTEKTVQKQKPEDVIPNAEAKNEVKTPEKAIESFKGQAAEENKNVTKKRPEIVKPETLKPQLDLDGLVEILNGKDYEEQANAMEAIAQVSKLAPEKADELLDVKVIDSLIGIMSQDTSKVPEADRKVVQRNKEYAMYTTAILQKQYTDGVKKVADATVPMEEIVGMAGIINELKSDEAAGSREAALASLSYIKAPEYKANLKDLLVEASRDIDPAVRKRAEKELAELDK